MSEAVVIGDATLYLGDCREILPQLCGEIVITDPVWPNAPADMFPGVEPEKLLREAFRAMRWCQRAVIVLRNDSDPRFLRAVPKRLPFFLCQWMQYAVPMYVGRKLGGNEIAE
jgi:site-specific DNA-methyltransferase (adenine-specific)/modification methylase